MFFFGFGLVFCLVWICVFFDFLFVRFEFGFWSFFFVWSLDLLGFNFFFGGGWSVLGVSVLFFLVDCWICFLCFCLGGAV